MAAHFNNLIKLTQVSFSQRDGKLQPQSGPYYVEFDDVGPFGDGWIFNKQTEEQIFVEENAATIHKLIDKKLKALHDYGKKQEKLESLGLNDGDVPDDTDDDL